MQGIIDESVDLKRCSIVGAILVLVSLSVSAGASTAGLSPWAFQSDDASITDEGWGFGAGVAEAGGSTDGGPTADRGHDPGPRITKVKVMDSPWEGPEATTIGVFVDNERADPLSVIVEGELIDDGQTVTRAASEPTESVPGVGQWVNLTMSASPGSYELSITLHSAQDDLRTQLDSRARPVIVTLPMDLPPSSYTRVQSNETERVGLPSEVASNETSVQMDAPEGADVLVYKPWLEHQLDSVTSQTEWTTVDRETGPWAKVPASAGSTVRFSTFDTTLGTVFTNGDERHVLLHNRPMWVTVTEEQRAHAPSPGETNATSSVDRDPSLAINFEDGNRQGQTIEFSAAWLADLGFSHPEFHYEDGTTIPFTFTGTSYLVHAPHFSTVYVDDADCNCEGETPPGWWYPTPPAEGVEFYVSDARASSAPHSIKAKGADDGEENLRGEKSLPEDVTPDTIRFEGYVGNKNGTDPHYHFLRFQTPGGDDLLTVNFKSQDASSLHIASGGTEYTQDFPMESWLSAAVTNIDWDACTYDLVVDGTTLDTGIAMSTSSCGDGIAKVIDVAKKWNAEPWWIDNLRFDDPGNFEDFNAPGYVDDKPPGWTRDSVGKAYEIDDTRATEAGYALETQGGSDDTHAQGSKALAGTAEPSSIAFDAYVGPHSGGSDDNWHVVELGSNPSLRAKLASVNAGDVRVETTNSGGGVATFPHESWTTVRFANIDWSSCTYDVEVGGSTAATGLSFDCSAMDEVSVRSKGWDSEPMWVDDIRYQTDGSSSDPLPTPPYSEAFDDGAADGWDLSGLWHVTDSCETPPSTPNYLGYHRTSACDYDTGSGTRGEGVFTVDLTGVSEAKLSFQDWRETEESAGHDQMYIDYNDGSGWSNLMSFNDSSNQLSWTQQTTSLKEAAGSVIDIRFVFDAVDDYNNAHGGWYIDDVEVTEGGANDAPTAGYSYNCSFLDCDFDGSDSVDSDGSITSYQWDFGDGATASGETVSHSFECEGTYTVELTVTDDDGATDSETKDISVSDKDSDGDGLRDCEETDTYNTDPNDADTDGDGLDDGEELLEWEDLGSSAWDTRYKRSAPTSETNNLLLWDADGDGIRDGLEFNEPSSVFGSCSDIDGRNECPDPRTREVYIHVNWMVDPGETCNVFFTCGDHNHRPSDSEVQRIYDNFANHSSGSSRLDSVNVHVYMDEGTRHADQITWAEKEHINDGDDSNEFYDWKQDFFPSEREGVFHYVLFAHENENGSAGRGEWFGDDLAVFDATRTSSDEVERTWMHELGHNTLGLYHSQCSNHSTHDHGPYANQDATHLDYENPQLQAFLDEYDADSGTCDDFDNTQDIFDHSSGAGAMSYNSEDTTYIDATWDDLKYWKMKQLKDLGRDGDQMVQTEEGQTWVSAPVSVH